MLGCAHEQNIHGVQLIGVITYHTHGTLDRPYSRKYWQELNLADLNWRFSTGSPYIIIIMCE